MLKSCNEVAVRCENPISSSSIFVVGNRKGGNEYVMVLLLRQILFCKELPKITATHQLKRAIRGLNEREPVDSSIYAKQHA